MIIIKKVHTKQIQSELDVINQHQGLFSPYTKSLYETIVEDVKTHELGFGTEYTEEELKQWLEARATQYKKDLEQIIKDYSSQRLLLESETS